MLLALYHIVLMLTAIAAGVASMIGGFYLGARNSPDGRPREYSLAFALGLMGPMVALGAVFALW